MAIRTLVRMFDDRAHAMQAIHDLEKAGFSADEVSVMATGNSDTTTTSSTVVSEEPSTGAGMGATIGTLLGGGAGLLAGIGAMAIPGLGPIVAAGWLAAALTGGVAGAAAGGLLGSLVSSGVDEREAQVYAEGVRRGGTLVTVRAEEDRLVMAERVLAKHQVVDVSAREADYRASGWAGYSEDNPPGTAASRAADRTLGTNMSGAHPENEPRTSRAGQITPRADDDGKIIPRQPDGAPGNPPGTEASRGVDQALGTNISGAHPENDRGRR